MQNGGNIQLSSLSSYLPSPTYLLTLDKLLCIIICFIFITNLKQLILCGRCKENLQTDKLAGLKWFN